MNSSDTGSIKRIGICSICSSTIEDGLGFLRFSRDAGSKEFLPYSAWRNHATLTTEESRPAFTGLDFLLVVCSYAHVCFHEAPYISNLSPPTVRFSLSAPSKPNLSHCNALTSLGGIPCILSSCSLYFSELFPTSFEVARF